VNNWLQVAKYQSGDESPHSKKVQNSNLDPFQFSAFMGATNGCESWSSFLIGTLIKSQDYPIALLTLCGASLFALPLLAGMSLPAKSRDDA
jgi:hypothetical protein